MKKLHSVIIKTIDLCKKALNKFNSYMEKFNKPFQTALIITIISGLIMAFILFVPNIIGVADDGSLNEVISQSGLAYIDNDEATSNDFFVSRYAIVTNGDYMIKGQNIQTMLIKFAITVDKAITNDYVFDIRFLAAIYYILFLPAFFLIIYQGCLRTKSFIESVAIGIVGALIFTDSAYISYFNSFYPEALYIIFMLWLAGGFASFQRKRSLQVDYVIMIFIVLAGLGMSLIRRNLCYIGLVTGAMVIKLIFARKEWRWRVSCCLFAVVLALGTVFSAINLKPEFNEVSKYHAMTRGVLTDAENPSKALTEFGIAPSYEMLAGTSLYDNIPAVDINSQEIKKEFMDKYNSVSIGAYYVKHIGAFVKLINQAVKSSFKIRRDFCGNYEESVNLPAGARSVFWTIWSEFKTNVAPQTMGFLLIIICAVILLYHKGYSFDFKEDRRNTIMLDCLVGIVIICFLTTIVVIVNSGNAELTQHCFIITVGIDILFYFVISEIIHKLNIL